jgi:flagellar biosynthesis/type III secretory pathway M-ring protein FliF/YscJ
MSPAFKFDDIGNYEITLIVKDSSNNSANDTLWLNVTHPDEIPQKPEIDSFEEWGWLIVMLFVIIIIILIGIMLYKRKKTKNEALEEENETEDDLENEVTFEEDIVEEQKDL